MKKKEYFRKKILTLRRKHPKLHKTVKDEKILRRLQRMLIFKKSKTLLLFASMPDEVHTLKLIEKILPKKTVVLPKTDLKRTRLTLQVLNHIHSLRKGFANILEPHPMKSRIISPKKIDLAIVPGIAFDLRGHRIGFGQGFYDRLLQKLRCPKIGLAYELQIVENIPVEKHDQHVDYLITEKKTYVTAKHRS